MTGCSFGYSHTWPEDLKALHAQHYRAVLLVENLENYIKRVDPKDFDSVMDQLTAAIADVQKISKMYSERKRQWESENSVLAK